MCIPQPLSQQQAQYVLAMPIVHIYDFYSIHGFNAKRKAAEVHDSAPPIMTQFHDSVTFFLVFLPRHIVTRQLATDLRQNSMHYEDNVIRCAWLCVRVCVCVVILMSPTD